jgi:predicted phosphohydrolase
MLKIQFASDLHLEFPENRQFLRKNPLKPMADVLVLAGDIVPFVLMDEQHDFWKYISDHFQLCFWVPGNHEYYHSDINGKSGKLDEKIMDNVYLVNNTAINWMDCRLIFSTLWTNIGPRNAFAIRQGMNDFHVIKNKGALFTPDHYNALHQEAVIFLRHELDASQQHKNLVFTHHVPSLMNYPTQYKGSVLNEAFAVELHGMIEATQPDYWIYGHSHANTPEFCIGKTRVCTNQLGYVRHNEHKTFRQDAIISL